MCTNGWLPKAETLAYMRTRWQLPWRACSDGYLVEGCSTAAHNIHASWGVNHFQRLHRCTQVHRFREYVDLQHHAMQNVPCQVSICLFQDPLSATRKHEHPRWSSWAVLLHVSFDRLPRTSCIGIVPNAKKGKLLPSNTAGDVAA